MVKPYTSPRHIIYRLPLPSFAGVHRFVPVRKTLRAQRRSYRKRRSLTPAERECLDARGSAERVAALEMLIEEISGEKAADTKKRLLKYLKVETMFDLTGDRFHDAVEALKHKRDAQQQQV